MLLDQNPQEANLAAEIEPVKLDLQKIAEHKMKGAIIRSRAWWYKHGKRNTKYFMNLEKRSHEKKHIVKLKPIKTSTLRNQIGSCLIWKHFIKLCTPRK